MTVETLQMLSTVAYVLAGIFLLAAIAIFFLLDIRSVIGDVTGATARKAIRDMEGGPTVFIVSQRAASIRHADQIIVLDDGEVAGIGTHEQLLEECAAYQEIYYSQFEKSAAKTGAENRR